MKNELIKYWNFKSWLYTSMLALTSQLLFIILGAILINGTAAKIINILLICGINILVLAILLAFALNNYTYETVYQIKVTGSTYETKKYRYLLILFCFGWLIFFLLNSLFMLINNGVYHQHNDYFTTLGLIWWKLALVTIFNLLIIITHRQLLAYCLHHAQLPWTKKTK